MTLPPQSTRPSYIKKAILVLGLTTGLVHLVVLNFVLVANGMGVDLLFTLNGLGYLVLLAAFFNPKMAPRRNYIRWLLIVFTLLTILAWIIIGDRGWLGILTKLVEIALVVFLLYDPN